MTRRIALVGFERAQLLDILGPYEVFAAANRLRRAQGAVLPPYSLTLLGSEPKAIRGENGLSLEVDASFLGFRVGSHPLHTLLVCGGDGARKAARDPKVKRAVIRLAKGAGRLASVCTGAFVLAAAGLLDGKRATTHWARCEQLAKLYPAVTVEGTPIYVRDGNVWTSAGVTAGIDLALAMVEDDLGRSVASEIARWLVVFVRRAGGQAQFSAQLSVQSAERAPLRELIAWVVDHPDAQLDVPRLAAHARMSVRHFTRLFRAETGTSPAAYVERVRIETARRLLETSERSVEQVAEAAGFGTPEALRRAFSRRLELSPREYRARFGVR